ncbi:MAG: helix-turn-helix domain-containing protein, partial [Deltaproteobacteria bacterium]|nr:helix-turn-helix domain-containing protein [Deltaproteobacteria bacterium]
ELPAEGISLRDVERELVIEALERTGYVQKDAAALIGVSRRKLNYMIQRMGITHPAWRRNRGAEDAAEQPARRAPSDADTP